MLNARISAAAYAKLSEVEQSHYMKDGDDFVLDIKGDTPEMARLRQSNTQLNNQVLDETNRRVQAEQLVQNAESAAEAKYKAELEAAKNTVTAMRETTAQARQSALIEGIANQFKMPELFTGVLKDRIVVEYDDKGKLVERFTDHEGKPCTLEQLTDAYCKNPNYSAMLKAPQTTATMPTNTSGQQNSPLNTPFSGAQQQNTFAPQFNVGSNQPNTQSWRLGADGKPEVLDYAALRGNDNDYRAYAEAKLAYTGSTKAN